MQFKKKYEVKAMPINSVVLKHGYKFYQKLGQRFVIGELYIFCGVKYVVIVPLTTIGVNKKCGYALGCKMVVVAIA